MGLVSSIAEKMSGGRPVDAAQRVVEKAQEALAAEEGRQGPAAVTLEEAKERASAVDPDDAGAFEKALAAVTTATARCDALAARRDRAAQALEEARAALREAETTEKREELARLDAEIQLRGERLTAAAQALARKIILEQQELRSLVAKSAQLVPDPMDAKAVNRLTRGVRWLEPGAPLDLAARIIGSGS